MLCFHSQRKNIEKFIFEHNIICVLFIDAINQSDWRNFPLFLILSFHHEQVLKCVTSFFRHIEDTFSFICYPVNKVIRLFDFFKDLFTYLIYFWLLVLHCCVGFLYLDQGLLFLVLRRLLLAAASLVERRLYSTSASVVAVRGLSS